MTTALNSKMAALMRKSSLAYVMINRRLKRVKKCYRVRQARNKCRLLIFAILFTAMSVLPIICEEKKLWCLPR